MGAVPQPFAMPEAKVNLLLWQMRPFGTHGSVGAQGQEPQVVASFPASCEGSGSPRSVSLAVGGCSGIFASQRGDRGHRADLPSHTLAPAEVSQLPAPHTHAPHPDDKHSDSDCPHPSSLWPKNMWREWREGRRSARKG